MKQLDREILEFLNKGGDSIKGSTGPSGQDAVGELIDLCDKLTPGQTGEIRDRLEVLLNNELIDHRVAGRRGWAEIWITDKGRGALQEGDDEVGGADDAAEADDNLSSKFDKVVARLRRLADESSELADDIEELGAAAVTELKTKTEECTRALDRAEAADARVQQLREAVTAVFDGDES